MDQLNNLKAGNEIEAIVGTKLNKIDLCIRQIQFWLKQSRQQGCSECWDAQIKHCPTLDEVASRLKTVADALEWELNGKKEWEASRNRKFDPMLECGDG